MLYYESIQLILEFIGTTAFAVSGALLGVRRNMDVFGIMALDLVIAVGGGVIRDLTLGITPPAVFTDSIWTLTAVVVSPLVFFSFYRRGDHLNSRFLIAFEKYLVFFDALGLAVSTIVGMNTVARIGYVNQHFLILFCGMVTGINGRIIRNLLVGIVPFVFIRQIYAVASFFGGILYLLTYQSLGPSIAMILGSTGVLVVRLLSYMKKWNLPRVIVEDIEEGKRGQ